VWGNLKRIKDLGYLDTSGRVMYDSCFKEIEFEAVGWFQLPQDKVQSQVIVSTVMNHQIICPFQWEPGYRSRYRDWLLAG
jgi:hypothetical protein